MTEALKAFGLERVPADVVRLSNTRVAALMSIFLNCYSTSIRPDQLEEISASCGVSRDEAYAECVAALCDVGSNASDRMLTEKYLKKMIRELDVRPYLDDPYYRVVRDLSARRGGFELKMMELQPCEAFVFDDCVVDKDGRILPQIGYFNTAYRYPALLENGREWMTLMPNETATTAPAVRRASGRVLTYGLGLGYFAFMASGKPSVSRVTVVEQSREVIELFREFLLPVFPNGDKIELVEGDAFSFAESLRPGDPYDYVFADIWHDVGDGRESYLRFKALEKNLPGAVFEYWLEKTILCYLAGELWLS